MIRSTQRDLFGLLATATVFCTGIASAQGATTYSNDTGGSVTFYGQLSPAYLSFDDGEKTYGDFTDNARSNSRVGFNLSEPINGGNKLGFRFETALGLPQSSAFSQDHDPIWNWEKTSIRHVDGWVEGDWGKVSVGQGSMATDGIAGSDSSQTTVAGSVTISDVGGSYFFRQKDGDLSDIQLGDVYDDFDGNRKGRVRYDTPTWNGLRFAAAYGEEILKPDDGKTLYDLAVFYKNDFQDVEVGAALGYAWEDFDDSSVDTGESWAGSIRAIHKPTGLNGNISMGSEKDGGSYWYVKGGWISELVAVGPTALSIDYYSGSDFVTGNDASNAWGVQISQRFDDQNIAAFLAYNAYSYEDDTDVSYQDASSIFAGLRWQF